MDEYGVIKLLARLAGRLPSGYTPIGDDVAAIPSKRGKLVLKSDMLVAKTDVPPGMTWRQAGRKSVAMCVSDFAAKGVRPDVFMVSMGLPRTLQDREIRSLALGFHDGMREWGMNLIGGDTNEADDVIVDCILAGFADRIVGRGGAAPGDLVVVTGEFGTTSAGLKILLDEAKAHPAFRRKALRNVYIPSPRLELGLVLSRLLSSAMDSSDGLAICLHTLAEMSGVGMRIDRIPHARALERFSSENRYDLDELLLYGGEEYEIVGTIRASDVDEARRAARAAGGGGGDLFVIGETTTHPGQVAMADGSLIERRGWVHLDQNKSKPRLRRPSRSSRTS